MATLDSGRSHRLSRWMLTLAFGVFVLCCVAGALCGSSSVHAMQDEHVTMPRSRYETGATGKNAYVGDGKCITCHRGMSSGLSTQMGRAALDPRDPDAPNYSTMSYHDGSYTITIAKGDHDGLEMRASDGSASLAAPIRWIFGQGYDGQTFILEKDGKLYESRASYYLALSNLDLTIGHSSSPPKSLIAALGRPLPEAEVKKCFSCHTSEDVFDGRIDVKQAHPGVTCENCHGAGSDHVSLMASGGGSNTLKDADIFAGILAPVDMNDFCGRCHRTTHDVLSSGIRDIRNVRFQPYRLENSRCYDPSDPRITCVACHDPHRKLETASATYDERCLSCHVRLGEKPSRDKTAAACPRATKDCTSCHMPKLDLPGAHFAFTDHYIRIVKPNEPYPN